jgi:hypothetical protein
MAHPLANLFARQRQHLIDHNLRHPIEAILPTRIESDAKQRCINNRTGQWHDCNATVNIVEDIRLDD